MTESKEQSPDLFETFKTMSMPELSRYTQGFNVFVSNGTNEGVLIGYMDMEPSPKRVKVVVNGKMEYWADVGTEYVRAEKRQ